MDEYFIGQVQQYDNHKIVFESAGHGYVFQGVHLERLPLQQELKLYVYFYQRLPTCEYYAFVDQATKVAFLTLITISYIGPKLALRILNAFTWTEFNQILTQRDVVTLQTIKGVSKELAVAIIAAFSY